MIWKETEMIGVKMPRGESNLQGNDPNSATYTSTTTLDTLKNPRFWKKKPPKCLGKWVLNMREEKVAQRNAFRWQETQFHTSWDAEPHKRRREGRVYKNNMATKFTSPNRDNSSYFNRTIGKPSIYSSEISELCQKISALKTTVQLHILRNRQSWRDNVNQEDHLKLPRRSLDVSSFRYLTT